MSLGGLDRDLIVGQNICKINQSHEHSPACNSSSCVNRPNLYPAILSVLPIPTVLRPDAATVLPTQYCLRCSCSIAPFPDCLESPRLLERASLLFISEILSVDNIRCHLVVFSKKALPPPVYALLVEQNHSVASFARLGRAAVRLCWLVSISVYFLCYFVFFTNDNHAATAAAAATATTYSYPRCATYEAFEISVGSCKKGHIAVPDTIPACYYQMCKELI